jgi:nicotinamide-nucleotide amidase
MLLPGPPRELRPMFLEQCEPRLERIESPYKYYTSSMRIVGLGESDVDQRIGPIYSAEPRAQTTILAAPGDIQLHVRGRAETVDQAREIAEAIAEKVAAELGEHVYARSDRTLEEIVANLLRERSLRLAVAESCTGGMIAERLTAIAGSSDYFVGGWVSYSPAAKADWLGVQAATIEAHGVYSEQTAREMAERARVAAGGEGVGLSVTGIAGPAGGSDETPVGTVFLGVADSAGTVVKRRQFGGDRARNRQLASQSALDLLRRRLLGLLSE